MKCMKDSSSLRKVKTENIAMSILASGAIEPVEAVKYVSQLENVESVLFGASSQKHILQTKTLIEELV